MLSYKACQLASMIFVLAPTVLQRLGPCSVSIKTRTVAPVEPVVGDVHTRLGARCRADTRTADITERESVDARVARKGGGDTYRLE